METDRGQDSSIASSGSHAGQGWCAEHSDLPCAYSTIACRQLSSIVRSWRYEPAAATSVSGCGAASVGSFSRCRNRYSTRYACTWSNACDTTVLYLRPACRPSTPLHDAYLEAEPRVRCSSHRVYAALESGHAHTLRGRASHAFNTLQAARNRPCAGTCSSYQRGPLHTTYQLCTQCLCRRKQRRGHAHSGGTKVEIRAGGCLQDSRGLRARHPPAPQTLSRDVCIRLMSGFDSLLLSPPRPRAVGKTRSLCSM